MTGPVVNAVSTFVDNSLSATSITINRPTGTSTGDILVAYISTRSVSGSHTGPSGWTQIDASQSNNLGCSTWWYVATGTDPGAWTWGIASGQREGMIVDIVGASATPIDAHAKTASSSAATVQCPSITSTVDSDLLLCFGAQHLPGSGWTVPSGMTLIATLNTTRNVSCSAASLALGVAGLVGAKAFTGPGTAATAGMTVALASGHTAPGRPTAVSATPGNTQATVSFTAPAGDGGDAITGYTVTSTPGSLTATGASSPLTVTGLTNGTSYTFTIHATNTNGSSAESIASSPVTPAGVPGAPTAVVAVGGDTLADVSWTAPASNGGSAITGYTVTSSPGSFTATTTGATTATVTGLTDHTTVYTFTVKATNAVGDSSASSASNPVIPDVPTGLRVEIRIGGAWVVT